MKKHCKTNYHWQPKSRTSCWIKIITSIILCFIIQMTFGKTTTETSGAVQNEKNETPEGGTIAINGI